MKKFKFFTQCVFLLLFLSVPIACDDNEDEIMMVDSEARYSVNAPKEVNDYVNGDILASASDSDGAITQATLQSGSSLPAGVALNSTSGELTVSNVSALMAGSFSLSIITTDSEGGTTDNNVTLLINERVDTDASYVINDAKITSEYVVGESIATVSDIDAAIVDAVLTNGTMLPEGTSLDSTTGEITIADPSLLVAGEYAFEITTEDALGGTTTHMITLTFVANPFVLNINSGSDELVFTDITYTADAFFVGTSVAFTPDPIPEIENTDLDELYVTERYGDDFGYAIDVDNATYKVTLHFVELYWGAPGLGSNGGAGDRVFDVLIEDILEIDDYDIFNEVGALFAVEKEFEVSVIDGTLNIDFLASVDNAKITAIQIEKMN